MKTLKILNGGIAVMLSLALANMAIGQVNTPPQLKDPLKLTVSGTVKCQKVEGAVQGSTATYSINEKTVYLLVSNYVANAPSYSYTNIAGTNLPANGYIAFNPNQSLFYVTNKAGFYYPLSGYTGNQYFSWIELDSVVFYGDDDGYLAYGLETGNFNTVAGYNLDSEGDGSSTSTSTAVLYIHDDPFKEGDADNPDVIYENDNPWQVDEVGHNNSVIEIRGVLTTRLNFKGIETIFGMKSESLLINGSGNFFEHDLYNLNGVLTSGHASLAP